MARKLKVAAVQMEGTPAPAAGRLERASKLVAEVVQAEADMVVLPECFNTGYGYVDSNYDAAEPLDGLTVGWMKAQARQHNIHLVGTLMLRDGDDVYNSALLFAPDGRMWRYDKRYPFNWERAYFREGHQSLIAETDLGKFGMMICWDSAHANLWEQYAGKVDAVIIPSCPPKINDAELVFDDGKRIRNWFKSAHFADQDIHDQAAWLNVPVVHSAAGGKMRSPMPLTTLSVMGLLMGYPLHWSRLRQAAHARLEADYGQHTQIISADGAIIGRVMVQGDSYTLAEVELSETMPIPVQPQPRMRSAGAAYFFADIFGPAFFRLLYRSRMRQRSKQ